MSRRFRFPDGSLIFAVPSANKATRSENSTLFRFSCGNSISWLGGRFFSGCFRVSQHLVERGAVEFLARQKYRRDFRRVVNVSERIGIQQNKIGNLAGNNRSILILDSHEFRWIPRCRLKSCQRGQAGFHQERELVVETESGEAV